MSQAGTAVRAALGAVVGLVGLALSAAACGSGPGAKTDTVTVFAAASLTDAFTELAAEFERVHDGASVELVFGGSSSLREQILAGAPADVFASADRASMEALANGGEVGETEAFASNRLQIAVPAGNPAGVTELRDLGEPGLLIGLCAEEVPCGRLAHEVLAAAHVRATPDTLEPDVRSLLTKIADRELDVGLVYATDVLAAGDAVEGLDLPTGLGGSTDYPIASVGAEGGAAGAEAFVAFVLSDVGQAILRSHGFGAP